jgi:hypothetical protein
MSAIGLLCLVVMRQFNVYTQAHLLIEKRFGDAVGPMSLEIDGVSQKMSLRSLLSI